MDAANELLIVLKDDEVPEKKAGVEAILEAVTDEEVNDLLKLAQQITDFSKQNEVNGDDTVFTFSVPNVLGRAHFEYQP